MKSGATTHSAATNYRPSDERLLFSHSVNGALPSEGKGQRFEIPSGAPFSSDFRIWCHHSVTNKTPSDAVLEDIELSLKPN